MAEPAAATEVELLFDFVSPYAWLAVARADRFAAAHRCRFRLTPVLLPALLDATGRIANGEVRAARDVGLRELAYRAAADGLAFDPPPAHPFVSLRALRSALVFEAELVFAAVVRAIYAAGWERGQDLTDRAVLEAAVRAAGADAADLDARAGAAAIKGRLRATTERAVRRGAFGVPTFVCPDGELFWGVGSMDLLAAKLAGSLPEPGPGLARALAQPVRPGRRRAAGGG